jgi:hypothetical protein
MPNENCLKGFKCPECGQEDEFNIQVTVMATMVDQGTTDYFGDVEFSGDSHCACPECHHRGIVDEFCPATKEVPAKERVTRSDYEAIVSDGQSVDKDAGGDGSREYVESYLREQYSIIGEEEAQDGEIDIAQGPA